MSTSPESGRRPAKKCSELELPTDPSKGWRELGECAQGDYHPDLWFSDDSVDRALAARLCYSCPVRVECGRWADDSGQRHGIWGGRDRDARFARKSKAEPSPMETAQALVADHPACGLDFLADALDTTTSGLDRMLYRWGSIGAAIRRAAVPDTRTQAEISAAAVSRSALPGLCAGEHPWLQPTRSKAVA